METIFCGFTVYDAFMTSDLFGKGIVLLIIAISVYGLIPLVANFSIYNCTNSTHKMLAAKYRKSRNLYSLRMERMPIGVCNVEIFKAVTDEVAALMQKYGVSHEQLITWDGVTPLPVLSTEEINKVKIVAENTLVKQLERLEEGLSTIATVAAVAPSLGLFGTVWGVLVSFMSMADGTGAAIITNVAPGIGGALLTTFVGLVVSIPMTWCYNVLATRLRTCTVQAETFVDKLLADISLLHSAKERPMAGQQFIAVPSMPVQQPPVYQQVPQNGVGGIYNA